MKNEKPQPKKAESEGDNASLQELITSRTPKHVTQYGAQDEDLLLSPEEHETENTQNTDEHKGNNEQPKEHHAKSLNQKKTEEH